MKKALITVVAALGFILAACTENEPKKEISFLAHT